MSDNCKLRIKIGTDVIKDISDYSFYLIKSDSQLAFDIKESNIVITDFPDEHGDSFYIPPTPVKKAFDYNLTLMFYDTNINTANKKVSEFCESMIGKPITLFNDYKGIKIVGYYKSYKDVSFYRQEKDVITFDLVFYIPKPQYCDFNYMGGINKIYYGVNYTVGMNMDVASNYVTTNPFDIIIPDNSTSVYFAWESALGEPTSVIYKELNIEIKGIFIKQPTVQVVTESGTESYNLYIYTPAIPFQSIITYQIK